jgi:hypothetical protein
VQPEAGPALDGAGRQVEQLRDLVVADTRVVLELDRAALLGRQLGERINASWNGTPAAKSVGSDRAPSTSESRITSSNSTRS